MKKTEPRKVLSWEREWLADFETFGGAHNPWTVWQDFVSMCAGSIASAVDRRPEIWRKREDAYLATAARYSKEELERFSRMFASVVMAMEENPAQDFLGKLYMTMGFGGRSGPFFTSWDVAQLMAELEIGEDTVEKIKREKYISVSDPACGAGGTLLAFANVCKNKWGIEYQQEVFFVGQDIDPVVAKMCYIQLSLLGCPGYVVIGDSIKAPVSGSLFEPRYDPPESIWFTPMYYMGLWQFRKIRDDSEENAQSAPLERNVPISRKAPGAQMRTSVSIRDFFRKKRHR